METWGDRLRARARELGLTDVEVARRLGLAQGRYSAYVNGIRAPDLLLFVRICEALGTTPDVMLGVTSSSTATEPGISELLSILRQLDPDALSLVAALASTVARHKAAVLEESGPRLPQRRRGKASAEDGRAGRG